MPRKRSSEIDQPKASPPQLAGDAKLQYQGDHWMLSAGGQFVSERHAPGIVPALENGIAIVAYLNRKAPRAAGLAEISSTLGISKSHCHSLLKTLTHFDWLSFDEESKTYHLQAGILSDASSLLSSPIINVIRPFLTTLVERLELPCVLSEPLSDDTFVVIDRINAHHIMEVSFPVGHRFSRNAAAQMRAYLAWQNPERIDRWMQDWNPVAYTDSTVLDAMSLRAEIGATRRRGYARSVGEFTEGLMALALPIFDRSGRVAYIFNVSSLVNTLLPREEQVAQEMQRTAGQIHRAIAARVPPDFPS
ncbi:IclR family transcriptional regulator [Mesorhizobium sp. BAC0120]|uniref:IclR family transcriptional regulator n=1 Tax=Mesorhizobium sp. BAC0120 TaxID=3090670 RepID=UPI00298D38E4|nr:IclR family transcriptional regulator [Mesorhizobium sp. BAC0120]MDW6023411.1 IclR family transcriptional regulator [Mesorhizobium sp. BAC0120]